MTKLLKRWAMLVLLPALLAACGAAEPKWAPDAEVARATYVHGAPYTLTLYTVVANKSGVGAHSALMVNAPGQRAIFDPAGTFYHPRLPERNDVIFGMSDPAVAFYIDYHAREDYDVIADTIEVSPEVATQALREIMAYGAVPKANCGRAISTLLQNVAGFEDLRTTMLPNALMRQFKRAGGAAVVEETFVDTSPSRPDGMLLAPAL
ncbi:hypothetical protein AQS8620_00597 [Aquimixticola soesokkakensis]|uniref:Lipoprotein n=1 Tax=Aquimixticola soesokkakensis TaxID=1519096 RepID=A0A1Y5RS33_9RHOB|nr:hypothetical protein [Aquimixticola soesokkakensis]SLN21246.1 hypothetical protein AQS8620_00597 [Aquimixticola soesokkakensis]